MVVNSKIVFVMFPGMDGAGCQSVLRRDEDEQRMAQMSTSYRRKKENLMHPDYEMPRLQMPCQQFGCYS